MARVCFLAILVEFSLGKYAFWQIWSKKCQNLVILVKKPDFLKSLVQRMRKFGKFCLGNANSGHFR